MTDNYDRILEIVAEEPGENVDDLIALATNYGIDATAVEELIVEAADNDDIVEFDGRYWVMRKGRYGFDQFAYTET